MEVTKLSKNRGGNHTALLALAVLLVVGVAGLAVMQMSPGPETAPEAPQTSLDSVSPSTEAPPVEPEKAAAPGTKTPLEALPPQAPTPSDVESREENPAEVTQPAAAGNAPSKVPLNKRVLTPRQAVRQAATTHREAILRSLHTDEKLQFSFEFSGPEEVTEEMVRKYLEQLKVGMRVCEEAQKRKSLAVAGTVELKFSVGSDGSVVSGGATGGTIEDLRFRHCVVFKLRRLKWPQPLSGNVEINVQFSVGTP